MSKLGIRIGPPALATMLALGLFAASPASAEERVPLKDKHSKEQVNAACDAAGGFKVQGQSGGYGCYNPSNGVLVACDNGGDCMGFIPRAGAPAGKDLTILGPGKPDLAADPFKPKPRAPVRAPLTKPNTPASPG
jgi:hypothetical protein